MRVVLICAEYPPRPHGGIGTFNKGYAEALVRDGHAVCVVDIGERDAVTEKNGVQIVHVPLQTAVRFRSVMTRVRLLRALHCLARSWKPDIIEAPDFGGWLPFDAMPRTVVRLHTSGSILAPYNGDRVRRVGRWFERRTLARHPNWLAPSQFILNATKLEFGIEPKRWCVTPNPFESSLPGASGDRPEGRIILFVGYVSRAKGAIDLAHAMKMVMRDRADVRLVYIGMDVDVDGRAASAWIRETLGPFAARCHFTGRLPRSDVDSWYRNATVFAFPSRFESFGLVYLEAVAAGLPVVASNRSAEGEIFEDGETALLVDPDDHAALATKIGWLLDNPEAARAMADRASRDVLPRFTMQRCVDASVAFYREVMNDT